MSLLFFFYLFHTISIGMEETKDSIYFKRKLQKFEKIEQEKSEAKMAKFNMDEISR